MTEDRRRPKTNCSCYTAFCDIPETKEKMKKYNDKENTMTKEILKLLRRNNHIDLISPIIPVIS